MFFQAARVQLPLELCRVRRGGRGRPLRPAAVGLEEWMSMECAHMYRSGRNGPPHHITVGQGEWLPMG